MDGCQVIHGDCLEHFESIGPVDSIVTDPPYGLSFMGKAWDHGVPGVEFWSGALSCAKPGSHLLAFGGTRTFHRLTCAIEDAGWEIRDCLMWVYGSGFPKSHNLKGEWEGWGTCLKPAWEPVILARKPLSGTVANNVLTHRTGALNIDACRVALNGDYKCGANGRPSQTGLGDRYDPEKANRHSEQGRWPANLIHDGSDEVVEMFPESAGSGRARNLNRGKRSGEWGMQDKPGELRDAGSGSSARFFYCAKASKSDRGPGNNHPTVKPTTLMRYLCRLITPPGGTVLDPFAGSGSTGVAAIAEGFRFIGIESEERHVEICKSRLNLK